MKTGFSTRLFLTVCMAMGLALGACDQQGEEKTAEAAIETQAGDEPLPAASVPDAGSSVTANSSMAEDSPGGEGVTAEEIPHSDVPPPSREVFTDAECDYEGWVGKPVDEAAAKETGRPYRILTPDSMMTMDHNPERINVVHDTDGKVTRVWCG